jgi:hypothetical protein
MVHQVKATLQQIELMLQRAEILEREGHHSFAQIVRSEADRLLGVLEVTCEHERAG